MASSANFAASLLAPTNALIAMGAALFTAISAELGGHTDPTRIAAQIVTGVGFLGAGAILRDHGAVVGLTTAATLFVVAAIGVAIGADMWWPALVATTILLCTLLLLVPIERALKRRRPNPVDAGTPEVPSDHRNER